MSKAAVIIVAAGKSRRFRTRTAKQFFPLKKYPVFLWSVLSFKKIKEFSQIILVVPDNQTNSLAAYKRKYNIDIVPGGKKRTDSVKSGLNALNRDIKYVAIHDGARPLVSGNSIRRCLNAAKKFGASLCAQPVNDTVKLSTSSLWIQKTIPRNRVWLAQTPQIFRRSLIETAYRNLKFRKITDDAQAAELIKRKVKIVPSESTNIKITNRRDIRLAEMLLNIK